MESEGTLPFSAYLIIWLFELGVESKLALFLFSFSLELAPINKAAWFRLANCMHDFQKPPHNVAGTQPLAKRQQLNRTV